MREGAGTSPGPLILYVLLLRKERSRAVSEYILEMEGIHKSFPGVHALSGVHLAVKPGTVHGVMGENGAGKSTLMKIAIGLYRPDAGTIRLRGKPVSFESVNDALTQGISMIHQEMSPLPYMTVAQNIFLGRELKNRLGLIDHKAIDRGAAEMLKELKINLTPGQIMGKLSVAQMQLVEIAEAVSRKADLIIMDEPTSALTEKEVAHLFSIIKDLKQRGVAVIYITHKMDEVFAITDEVSVYRDGEFVGREDSAEPDPGKADQDDGGPDHRPVLPEGERRSRTTRPGGGRPVPPRVFPRHQFLRPRRGDPGNSGPDRSRDGLK